MYLHMMRPAPLRDSTHLNAFPNSEGVAIRSTILRQLKRVLLVIFADAASPSSVAGGLVPCFWVLREQWLSLNLSDAVRVS